MHNNWNSPHLASWCVILTNNQVLCHLNNLHCQSIVIICAQGVIITWRQTGLWNSLAGGTNPFDVEISTIWLYWSYKVPDLSHFVPIWHNLMTIWHPYRAHLFKHLHAHTHSWLSERVCTCATAITSLHI